jgi:hypothetical protein
MEVHSLFRKEFLLTPVASQLTVSLSPVDKKRKYGKNITTIVVLFYNIIHQTLKQTIMKTLLTKKRVNSIISRLEEMHRYTVLVVLLPWDPLLSFPLYSSSSPMSLFPNFVTFFVFLHKHVLLPYMSSLFLDCLHLFCCVIYNIDLSPPLSHIMFIHYVFLHPACMLFVLCPAANWTQHIGADFMVMGNDVPP